MSKMSKMVAFSFHSPTIPVKFCFYFVVFVSEWSNILHQCLLSSASYRISHSEVLETNMKRTTKGAMMSVVVMSVLDHHEVFEQFYFCFWAFNKRAITNGSLELSGWVHLYLFLGSFPLLQCFSIRQLLIVLLCLICKLV